MALTNVYELWRKRDSDIPLWLARERTRRAGDTPINAAIERLVRAGLRVSLIVYSFFKNDGMESILVRIVPSALRDLSDQSSFSLSDMANFTWACNGAIAVARRFLSAGTAQNRARKTSKDVFSWRYDRQVRPRGPYYAKMARINGAILCSFKRDVSSFPLRWGR